MARQILRPERLFLATRSSGTQMTLASGIYKNFGGQQYTTTAALTMNTGSVGAGGLDTGVLQAFKLYYVYLVLNGSSLALVASLNNGATGPTGFTFFRMIGAFFTDGTPSIATQFNSLQPLVANGVISSTINTSFSSNTFNFKIQVVADDFVKIDGNTIQSAAPGAATLTAQLPSWCIPSTSKNSFANPEGEASIGTWWGADQGVLPYHGDVGVNSVGLLNFGHSFGSPNIINATSPFAWNTNDGFNFGGTFYVAAGLFGPIVTGF